NNLCCHVVSNVVCWCHRPREGVVDALPYPWLASLGRTVSKEGAVAGMGSRAVQYFEITNNSKDSKRDHRTQPRADFSKGRLLHGRQIEIWNALWIGPPFASPSHQRFHPFWRIRGLHFPGIASVWIAVSAPVMAELRPPKMISSLQPLYPCLPCLQ